MRYSVKLESVKAIVEKYGACYREVLQYALDNPALKETFCSCSPFIKAQIVYAIKNEMAQTVDDIMCRRLGLSFVPCRTRACENTVAQFVAELCQQRKF